MKRQKLHIILLLPVVLFMILGCIETFEAETIGFEGVLVVDARMTDEQKKHEVFLSRLRPFEQDSITPETNAAVSIIEDSETVFEFEEVSPGNYISTSSFAGKGNHSYQLSVNTADGLSFSSNSEIMPENIPIADIAAKRVTQGFGDEGIAVVVDNSSLGNQPRYFRYTYEEAYKIVAPNWDPFEFEIIDDVACLDGDAFEVGIKTKNGETGRICYGQKSSTDIILGSTENLEGNTLSNFMVRFINRNNYILTHRYSILVNQYTQNVNAHSYYQNLDDFSSSESIFSETQPGFLEGNVVSDNSDAKVIGYFEAASVSSKRVYFNYEDFFPQETLPDYPGNCDILGNPQLIAEGYHCTTSTPSVCDGNCASPLIDNIKANLLVFAGEKEPSDIIAPYFTLPRACGDCTVLGSDIKPDFWIEE